jgi:hypothetical protein
MAHDHWIPYGDRGAYASATTAAHAPDFVRHDRGPDDEHWAHAFAAICARCCQLIEDDAIVRRRLDGDYVHERCPLPLSRPA